MKQLISISVLKVNKISQLPQQIQFYILQTELLKWLKLKANNKNIFLPFIYADQKLNLYSFLSNSKFQIISLYHRQEVLSKKQSYMFFQKFFNQLISYHVFLNLRINNIGFFWNIIKIFNALILLLQLTRQKLLVFLNDTSTPILGQIALIITKAKCCNNQEPATVIQIGYILLSLFVTFAICLTLFFKMNINLTSPCKQGKLASFVLLFPLFAIIIVQIFYFTTTIYIFNGFVQIGSNSGLTTFALVCGFLFWSFVTLLNYRNRLFYFMFIPVIICSEIFNELVTSVLIIISIVVVFLVKKDKQPIVGKCIYRSFALLNFMQVIYSLISNIEPIDTDRNASYLSMMYISVSIVFLSIITTLQQMFQINLLEDKANNRFLASCVKKLEQTNAQNLSNIELVKIESIYKKFQQRLQYQNKQHQICTLNFKQNKSIRELSFIQLRELVDIKLEHDYRVNVLNLDAKKQFLLFRIYNLYKIYETINTISQFVDYEKAQQKVSLGNYHEKYVLKHIQLIIFEQFLSKQSYNQKIAEMIHLSHLSQNFIQKSMQLLISIHSFWEKINTNILVEGIIEKNFQIILNDIAMLQEMLVQLKSGYKADWESKIMAMILSLTQPSIRHKSQYLNWKSNYQFKEQSLVFFVIRNKIITNASLAFLNTIEYVNQQIINASISKIMPEEVIRTIKLKQSEAIQSNKGANIIPIICGSCIIKVYQANVKLQPAQNAKIQFFYILKQIQRYNEDNLAYIYLSSIDLKVKYVSLQFYEIFMLKRHSVKSKIQRQGFYLSTIITNINPNDIVPNLENKREVNCIFSVRFMKSKQTKKINSPFQFQGLLKLQQTFGTDFLVSVHLKQISQHINGENQQALGYLLKNEVGQANPYNKISYIYKQKEQQDDNQKNFKSYFSIKQTLTRIEDDEKQSLIQLDSNVFCPISNPYKQKIQQKQVQLSSQIKPILNYSNCTILLLAILVIILISITSILVFYSQQRKVNVRNVIQNTQRLTAHSSMLVNATFQVYFQYILTQNIDKIYQIVGRKFAKLSKRQLLEQQYIIVHQILYQFQLKFSNFIHRKKFNISYTIFYLNYYFQANYATTNLIDYAYNLKLVSQQMRVIYDENKSFSLLDRTQLNDRIQFLFDNYLVVSEINTPFEGIPALIDQYFHVQRILQVILVVLCALSLVILFLISYIIRCNLKTVKEIFYLFSVKPEKEIIKRLKEVSKGSQLFKQKFPKDGFKKLENRKVQKQKTMILYSNKVKKQIMKLIEQQNIPKQNSNTKQKKIVSHRNNPYISALLFFKGVALIALLFLGVTGLFFYKMQRQFKYTSIYLNYFNQIQIFKYRELKKSTDMLHYRMKEFIYRQNQSPEGQVYLKQNFILKEPLAADTQSFQYFFIQTNKLLKSSLCQINKSVRYLQRIINCEDVGLGILNQGYVQSSEYLDYLTSRLEKGKINFFQIGKSEYHENILLHLYVKQKLLHSLNTMQDILNENRLQQQERENTCIIILGTISFMCILALALFLIIKFIPNLLRIKAIGIGYFKLMKKQYLSKMQTSSYLNQKKILHKITYL